MVMLGLSLLLTPMLEVLSISECYKTSTAILLVLQKSGIGASLIVTEHLWWIFLINTGLI